MLERFREGVTDDGELLKAEVAQLISASRRRSVLELTLTEGKNREIRRLCAALNLVITRLQRRQIGTIKLGELPQGKWRTLTETEIKSLLAAK